MVIKALQDITERIEIRSSALRNAYLKRLDEAVTSQPRRTGLSCGNQAHGFAGCGAEDKARIKDNEAPSIGIVTAYNDMLSAHKPYETYPGIIRDEAYRRGAVAQVAGGVPAMCDGVTQGQTGMELSLFSRDIIAQSTAIALSHDMFDAALYLGICDKIVPGLLIGALSFGHLPGIFVPAGPMPTGQSNEEKTRIRKLYAEGKVDKVALLESEAAAYHAPGTCTFYGTANSNQFLMDIMGLHLPSAAFVPPDTPLRESLTRAATAQALNITRLGHDFRPIGQIVTAKTLVNAVVGLHATGGSTNHTMHLVAIARAAGFQLTWQDFADLSTITPLVARVYPNGSADVNGYHQAGGSGFTIATLIDAGLIWPDAPSVYGENIADYAVEVSRGDNGKPLWHPAPKTSRDTAVIRTAKAPFSQDGGLRILGGNLGTAVMKVSSVEKRRWSIKAPARIFHSQQALQVAFDDNKLNGDFIAVIRFQGPSANGMPELHALTPLLSVLQDRGQRVALVTDGRMSGASGRVPAAIHLTPEAAKGGDIAKLRDGDLLHLDASASRLDVVVDETEWQARTPQNNDHYDDSNTGYGRELFAGMRQLANPADKGGGIPLSG